MKSIRNIPRQGGGMKRLYLFILALTISTLFLNVYGKVNRDFIEFAVPIQSTYNTWSNGFEPIRPPAIYIVKENEPLKNSDYYQFLTSCLENGAFPWKRSIKVFYNRLTPNNIGNYAQIDLERFLKKKGEGNVGSVYLDNREIEAYTSKRDKNHEFIETAPETNKVIIIKKTLDSKYKDWVKKMEGKFEEMNENPSYLMSQYFDTLSYDFYDLTDEKNKSWDFDHPSMFIDSEKTYEDVTKHVNEVVRAAKKYNKAAFKNALKEALKQSYSFFSHWDERMRTLSLFNIIKEKEKENLTDEEDIWNEVVKRYINHLAQVYDVMIKGDETDNTYKAMEVFNHIAKKVKEDKDVYDITNFVELNSTKEFTISATKVGGLDLLKHVMKTKESSTYTLNVGSFVIDFTENDMTILFKDGVASQVIFYQARTLGGVTEDDSEFLDNFYNSVSEGTASMYFIKQQYFNVGRSSLLEESGGSYARAPSLIGGSEANKLSLISAIGLETLIITWKDSKNRQHIKVIMPYRQHGFTVTGIGLPVSNNPPIGADREIILPEGWGLSGVGQKIKLTYYNDEDGIKKYGYGIQTYLIIKDEFGNNMVLDSSIIFDKETLIRKIEELYIIQFYGDTY